jgi:hypothetical protein
VQYGAGATAGEIGAWRRSVLNRCHPYDENRIPKFGRST